MRVLSYNLFWWNLFNMRGGVSAENLIKATSTPEPYDVIGLQECEDPDKVFKPVGMDRVYSSFLGSKAVCVAYRTDKWELLDNGEDEVAMDMRTEFYGHRVAQWLRLKNKANGMTMLFVNHHGPLAVNSGGTCGGKSTAHNLLKVMWGACGGPAMAYFSSLSNSMAGFGLCFSAPGCDENGCCRCLSRATHVHGGICHGRQNPMRAIGDRAVVRRRRGGPRGRAQVRGPLRRQSLQMTRRRGRARIRRCERRLPPRQRARQPLSRASSSLWAFRRLGVVPRAFRGGGGRTSGRARDTGRIGRSLGGYDLAVGRLAWQAAEGSLGHHRRSSFMTARRTTTSASRNLD